MSRIPTNLNNNTFDKQIVLKENNKNFSINCSNLTEHINLTFPNTYGYPDQILKTNGCGVLDWINQPSGGGGDITSIVAGDGLSGGSTSGDATLNVNVDNSTIEINNSGLLNVKDGGITNNKLAGGITNDQLAGSIANSKLSASTVSYGGVALALGETDATPAFDLTDATNYPTSSLSGTITNAQLAGSITNDKLSASTVSYGGVSLALGETDDTPSFDLTDATNYPTSSLSGTIKNSQLEGSITNDKLAGGITNDQLAGGITNDQLAGGITNDQLAGSIENSKLSASTVSYGGVTLALGETDATPSFDLTYATGYPTSSLSGAITNDQLEGSITNSKLSASTVSYGGVTLALGETDATPAFDLTDATNYPTSSLSGTITNAQLAGSIANNKLANNSITINSSEVELGGTININTGGNLKSGSGIDINSNTISVDVSDFMKNGVNNRILTSTGADNMNAESNLTFDGSKLTITGDTEVTGDIIPSASNSYDLGSSTKAFRDLYLSGSTLNLGGYSISVSSTSGTNELVVKDDNNEHVHIHSHIKNKTMSKKYSTTTYINVSTSWLHVDPDITLTYTAHETGTYLVYCGYGIAWFTNPNWLYAGLSNTTSTTPSLISGARQQLIYTGGGYYHREQINTTFVVDLIENTTYNFRLAVKKLYNYSLVIYRGHSSLDGSPHGYIEIRGPIS